MTWKERFTELKVGDRVRLLTRGSGCETEPGCSLCEECLGEILTIESISNNQDAGYFIIGETIYHTVGENGDRIPCIGARKTQLIKINS